MMIDDYTLLELHHQRIAERAVLSKQQVWRTTPISPHAVQRVAQIVGNGCVQLGERLLAYGYARRVEALPATQPRR